MNDFREEMEKLVRKLEQQRDELRVKMHLAKADVRDQFEKLERQWEEVRPRVVQAGSVASGTAKDVGSALKLALEELGRGYDRLRKLF